MSEGSSLERSRRLTLHDIADLRAYERERPKFLAHIIELKRQRRVSVGPFVTFVFENRDTIRFQIQEMARAEKIVTDEGIQTELDIYNPLIPEPGSLSATLFIELTAKDDLVTWLPKLVGIEQAVALRLGAEARRDGHGTDEVVRAAVDPDHAKQLTRETVTASVHYVHFDLTPAQVERFAAGPVRLEIDHPNYPEGTDLQKSTRISLLDDLRS
jgi:Protein of unknown function (DUF3501)